MANDSLLRAWEEARESNMQARYIIDKPWEPSAGGLSIEQG